MNKEIYNVLFMEYLCHALILVCWILYVLIVIFRPRFIFRITKPGFVLRRKFIVLVGLALFPLLLLQTFIFGSKPWERYRVLKNVLEISETNLISVDLIPWGRDSSGRPVVIRDRAQLKSFCDCLNNAKAWDANYYSPKWEYKVKLHEQDKTYPIVVQGENGLTIISIYDHDDGGLSIGNVLGRFRCDALGVLIRSWVNEGAKGK
jgi:hypothetical protein